ncbi:unnamed protein product [Schistosoma rodhaini]|uniref:BPTI/Kunitz inhibitor domain-containing protein n=1 Tax=Schistosoma rodhaini TaxID=6188 RepID=A0AA85FEB4_9TREM|nr:unnamed protein product [Schistosoma rodhaini]
MFSFCLYGTLLLLCVQSVASYRKGNSDCLLDYDEGICRALLKRFYYDSVNQTCEIFYYGGCLGNGNNFISKDECERKCGGRTNRTEKSFDNTETTITTQKPLSVGAKIVLGILDIKNKVSNLFKKIKGEK